ncbi:glycosyltransferase family 4 protein, partial [Methylopila musalis]
PVAEALAFRRVRLDRAALPLVASAHLERLARETLPAAKVRRLALTPIAPGPETPEPATGFHVLTVGTLTPKKGQRRLLDLWPQVLAAVPDARLHIVGDGPCRQSIRDGVEQHGLHDSVQMHGRAEGDALEALFAGCHVVALPTAWPEPFGRVALEAGAHGRPVVAYAVGGHAETIVPGETGILAPPEDGEAFVAGLTALARDPALRARLGAAGR